MKITVEISKEQFVLLQDIMHPYAIAKTYGTRTSYKYPSWKPEYRFDVDWSCRVTGKSNPTLTYEEDENERSPLHLIGLELVKQNFQNSLKEKKQEKITAEAVETLGT